MKNVLLIILIFSHLTSYTQNLEWIPFRWAGGEVSDRYFDKLAIKIPVTIDDLDYNFQMQLDLGAVNTTIYGNAFQDYLDLNSKIKAKIDTTLQFTIQGKKNFKLKDVNLKLGTKSFGKRNIGLFKQFGKTIPKDSLFTNSEKNIGTIAPDLFQEKILVIDFPNQRIAVLTNINELPGKLKSDINFKVFKAENGRIKIPLNINGKEEFVMFDTGSSIFPLGTTQENAVELGGVKIADTLKVSSWGEKINFYGREIQSDVKFGDKILEKSLVYADENNSFKEFYDEEHIWGIVGNAYFWNHIVVIDYKNKLFGIN